MSWLAGLRLAVGTLTIIPSGDIGEIDRRTAGTAMALAPVAALPLGIAAALVVLVGDAMQLPGLVTGGLVVGLLGLLTRGMHLDGLADTVDGLGAGWDRERALTVMRKGDVGPMGAAALVVTVLVQAACIGWLASTTLGWLVVGAAVVASRAACTLVCLRGIRPARGSGMGALVAASVPTWAGVLVSLAAGALVAGALGVARASLPSVSWSERPLGLAGSPLHGFVAWAVAAATVCVLVRRALRSLGGVTGDVIGAAVEVALTVTLVVLVAGGPR